jgi:hypothetical protein
MGTITKIMARVFNTCEACGSKMKADDQKYTITFDTWYEPNKKSSYDCTVCHECVNNFKLYELVSKVNIIRKLQQEEKE